MTTLLTWFVQSSILMGLGLVGSSVLRRAPAATRRGYWSALLCLVSGLPLLAATTADRSIVSQAMRFETSVATGGALSSWLFAGWLLGVAVVLVSAEWSGIGWRRRLWRGAIANDANLVSELDRVAVQFGIRRPVLLLTSPEVSSPMTWGVWRPVVVFPASAPMWSVASLRDALRHECAHIRTGDVGFRMLAKLLCALQWCNPLAWVLARSLVRVQEEAADAEAGRDNPRQYAQSLITIAAQVPGIPLGAAVRLLGETPARIEERILRVLSESRRGAVGLSHRFAVVAGLVLLTSVATVPRFTRAVVAPAALRPLVAPLAPPRRPLPPPDAPLPPP